MSKGMLLLMRSWLNGAKHNGRKAFEPGEVADMPDALVVAAVQRLYPGGEEAFLKWATTLESGIS